MHVSLVWIFQEKDMKKVAIALHSFIHNHIDVNEGDIVAGLSDAALSDLEKNGLVRFEDQDESGPANKKESQPKSVPKSATSPSKKIAANKPIDQTATANAKDVTKTAESASEDMADPASGNGANTANNSQSDSVSGSQSE